MKSIFKNVSRSLSKPYTIGSKLFFLLFISLFMSGCATTCVDTITLVPVEPKAEVKVQPPQKPEKPVLASKFLTKASTPDEVIKAALGDYAVLKTYSEELERLIK